MVIEWPHIEEIGKMRLAMTPTLAGTFFPEIYLVYTLNGKEYREVLETTSITAAKANINVPELVNSSTFKVSGKAMYYDEDEIKDSETDAGRKKAAGTHMPSGYLSKREPPKYVTVMDGNQPIGKAEIKSDGKWETFVTLTKPRTLSKHNIYAKIAYPTGVSYQTETRQLTYDPNAVVPLTTKMSFFNHHPLELKNVEVIFDYINGKASPSSYGFDNRDGMNTDFTFEVNLSTNDTTKVYACAVFINTEGPDAEERVVMAHYNKRKNRWIAYSKFNTRSLPYSVVVEPYYYHDNIGSADDFHDAYDLAENFFDKNNENIDALLARFDQLIDQDYAAALANDSSKAIDYDELLSVYNQLLLLTTGNDYKDKEPLTEDITDQILQTIENDTDPLRNLHEYVDEVKKLNELSDLVEGIITSDASGLTTEGLVAAGYEILKLDNGHVVYILTTADGSWSYVDLEENLKIDIPANTELGRRLAPIFKMQRRAWPNYVDFLTAVEFIKNMTESFVDVVGKIAEVCDAIIKRFDECIEAQSELLESLKLQL